jgi:hypothetical protein
MPGAWEPRATTGCLVRGRDDASRALPAVPPRAAASRPPAVGRTYDDGGARADAEVPPNGAGRQFLENGRFHFPGAGGRLGPEGGRIAPSAESARRAHSCWPWDGSPFRGVPWSRAWRARWTAGCASPAPPPPSLGPVRPPPCTAPSGGCGTWRRRTTVDRAGVFNTPTCLADNRCPAAQRDRCQRSVPGQQPATRSDVDQRLAKIGHTGLPYTLSRRPARWSSASRSRYATRHNLAQVPAITVRSPRPPVNAIGPAACPAVSR